MTSTSCRFARRNHFSDTEMCPAVCPRGPDMKDHGRTRGFLSFSCCVLVVVVVVIVAMLFVVVVWQPQILNVYVCMYVCIYRKQLALSLQAATRPDLRNALLQLFDYFLLGTDTRRSS